MRRTPLLFLAVIALLGPWFAVPANAAPRDPDPSFGTAGVVTLPNSQLMDTLIQPDGKILTLGFQSYSLGVDANYVARLEPSGAPDPAFGQGGLAALPLPGIRMGLQPSGGILIAGYLQSGIIRLKPNGGIDPAFGIDGAAEAVDPAQGSSSISALTVQSDGGFVIAGRNSRPGSHREALFVARYTADGLLDDSFSADGVRFLLTDCSNFAPCPSAGAVLALPSGTIVVMGGFPLPVVLRFRANGKLDTHFGSNGNGIAIGEALPRNYVLFSGRTGVVQPGRGILVGGDAVAPGRWRAAIVRFNANGTFDRHFGFGGLTTFDADPTQWGGEGSVRSMALTSGGTIVTGGIEQYIEGSWRPAVMDLVVAAINRNGRIRTSFGNGGHFLIDALDPGNVDPNTYTEERQMGGVAIQKDGKIVVAAARFYPDPAHTFVDRFLPP